MAAMSSVASLLHRVESSLRGIPCEGVGKVSVYSDVRVGAFLAADGEGSASAILPHPIPMIVTPSRQDHAP